MYTGSSHLDSCRWPIGAESALKRRSIAKSASIVRCGIGDPASKDGAIALASCQIDLKYGQGDGSMSLDEKLESSYPTRNNTAGPVEAGVHEEKA